jgi:hypothetical protein
MQDAFFLYDRSAGRGMWLRAVVDANRLAATRGKAVGCAASIALMQWYLGEAPINRRDWLLRAKVHLVAYDRERQATLSARYFKGDELRDDEIRRELDELGQTYFDLEKALLPADLQSPLPYKFRPFSELIAMGWSLSDTVRAYGASEPLTRRLPRWSADVPTRPPPP